MSDKKILHFSPERPFWRRWRRYPGYVSGDIKRNKVANTSVDITSIQFPNDTFDVLICHHVLEHVKNDKKAMEECFRVLKPTGIAFFSVPIDEVNEEGFEPPDNMPTDELERICGWDHKRIYGKKTLLGRLQAVGFETAEILFSGEEAERFRLSNDASLTESVDRVFTATKSRAA